MTYKLEKTTYGTFIRDGEAIVAEVLLLEHAPVLEAAPDLLEAVQISEKLIVTTLGIMRKNGISARTHNELAKQNLKNRSAIAKATP